MNSIEGLLNSRRSLQSQLESLEENHKHVRLTRENRVATSVSYSVKADNPDDKPRKVHRNIILSKATVLRVLAEEIEFCKATITKMDHKIEVLEEYLSEMDD